MTGLNRREAGERGREGTEHKLLFSPDIAVKMSRFFQILLPHTQSTLAFGNDTKLESRQRGFPRYASPTSLPPTTADSWALTTHKEGFPLLALRGDSQPI